MWFWLSPRLPRPGLRRPPSPPILTVRSHFGISVGYSWSSDPHSTFTQTDLGGVFITNAVGSDMENSWLAGAGFGSGPRGIRGEVMFDWGADRDVTGVGAAP